MPWESMMQNYKKNWPILTGLEIYRTLNQKFVHIMATFQAVCCCLAGMETPPITAMASRDKRKQLY